MSIVNYTNRGVHTIRVRVRIRIRVACTYAYRGVHSVRIRVGVGAKPFSHEYTA